jgi:putative addiction module component (TIGR02574 family)
MLDEIQHLPIGEKVRLVEELWDSICSSREPFPLQDWHRAEATRRAAELDADPSLGITREELWKQVGGNDQ